MFGAQALASLLAGVALATIGWTWTNLVTLPLIVAVLTASLKRGRNPFSPAT